MKKGFTLIEMLVTIAIIGILAGILIFGVNTVRSRSRDSKRISDLNRVKAALVEYYNIEKSYPSGTAYNSLPVPTDLPPDPINSGSYIYNYTSGLPSPSLCDQDNFALWAKMETNNKEAQNDGGYHNAMPNLEYETGNGDSWSSCHH